MSIYSDCSQAISDLSELRDVFTEIDVVNHAASDGWSKANFKEARKYANQIVSAKFRSGELVRYGTVEYDGIKDYARRASMIVYGGASSGPAKWTTPNGNFSQMPRHLDTIQSSGRKKGTARHDELPWSEQDTVSSNIRIIAAPKAQKGSSNGGSANAGANDEIARLNEALAQATAEVSELRAKLEKKDKAAPVNGSASSSTGMTRSEVEDLVTELLGEFEGRVSAVETKLSGLVTFAGAS